MVKDIKELFEYNTDRKKVHIPDYGRHIQKMVDKCVEEKDKKERQKLAEYIVLLMTKGNPRQLKIPEYVEKLWTHLNIISDYKLDVNFPCDISKKEDNIKIEKIPYPEKQRDRFKHYGVNLKTMIQTVKDMAEGEEKELCERNLVGNMKKKYSTWNKVNISEEGVVEDIKTLSKGKLNIDTSKWESLK